MGETVKLLVYTLEGQPYAIPVSAVESVIRAVAVTRLPHAPRIVIGIINVRGDIVPVVSMRCRIGLPERPIRPEDQFLLVRTPGRRLAVVVDSTGEVVERAACEVVAARSIIPGAPHCEGLLKLDDGLVVVYDLERFLSLEEEKVLDDALSGAPGKSAVMGGRREQRPLRQSQNGSKEAISP